MQHRSARAYSHNETPSPKKNDSQNEIRYGFSMPSSGTLFRNHNKSGEDGAMCYVLSGEWKNVRCGVWEVGCYEC